MVYRRTAHHMAAMTEKTPIPDSTASAAPNGSGANPPAATPPAGPAQAEAQPQTGAETDAALKGPDQKPGEIGGPQGPEPTRYGDWEFKGRCSDF